MASPTSRSLALLRANHWTVQVVERWNQYSKTRLDLFGAIDLLAMRAETLLAVQATTMDNTAAHIDKCLAEPRVAQWLRIPGARFEVWGWSQRGAKGKRKTWSVGRRAICLTVPESGLGLVGLLAESMVPFPPVIYLPR